MYIYHLSPIQRIAKQDIRTVTIDGEPWFVGKDVAEALGYVKARNAISTHVSEEDKKDAPIQGDLGGVQQMTIINESGLYALIFGSKLEFIIGWKNFKAFVNVDKGYFRRIYYKCTRKTCRKSKCRCKNLFKR